MGSNVSLQNHMWLWLYHAKHLVSLETHVFPLISGVVMQCKRTWIHSTERKSQEWARVINTSTKAGSHCLITYLWGSYIYSWSTRNIVMPSYIYACVLAWVGSAVHASVALGWKEMLCVACGSHLHIRLGSIRERWLAEYTCLEGPKPFSY
jgi:hypothetical protein